MIFARLKLIFEGADISADIAPYLIDFSYTDNEGGKADDLQVSLSDESGLWKDSWFPATGSTLQAEIVLSDREKQSICRCGTFEIDTVSLSGSPDVVRLKAASVFAGQSLKGEKKTRSWENAHLKQIVAEIALEHELSPFFVGIDEARLARIEQRQESDLAFVERLCVERDLQCKVTDGKLVVYDGAELELSSRFWSVERKSSPVSSFEFNTKAFDVYKACQITYWDASTQQELTYTFEPEGKCVSGSVLRINRRMESLAAAKASAKSALRQKNKEEITGRFEMSGNPVLLSGLTGSVAGYGIFDGKYIITQATHTYNRSSGYRTKINIRKVLGW